jgi:zinc transporter 9
VNDYRFKAEIEYNGRELTRLYLQEDCDMDKLQHEFENIQDMEQLQEFMMRHGEHLIDKVSYHLSSN